MKKLMWRTIILVICAAMIFPWTLYAKNEEVWGKYLGQISNIGQKSNGHNDAAQKETEGEATMENRREDETRGKHLLSIYTGMHTLGMIVIMMLLAIIFALLCVLRQLAQPKHQMWKDAVMKKDEEATIDPDKLNNRR